MQTSLGINGQDCTLNDGNTAAELEAIAITLLRAAEAIRNREEGTIECVAGDGQALAFVHLHDCGMSCELEENALQDPNVPALERMVCFAGDSSEFHAMARKMIDQYRKISAQ
jgi:hypothetical protein